MATITGYGSKHSHEFKLTINETSTNTTNNTSEVSFSFTIYKSSYSWSQWNNITYTITINDVSYTGTIPSYSAGSTMTIRSGSQTISHNSDGTKSINYSFSVNDGSGQSYTCGNASASGNFTLTTIPRASSVGATSAYIEENTIINISRASSNFRHTLTYSFHNLNGTIIEKTSSTSITWELPYSFYKQIPNKKSSWATINCITYDGDTEIGSSSCTFTVNTNEEKCKPNLSATVIDINSKTIDLTGNNEKLVKHKSTAKIIITTNAKNSASIMTKKVNNVDVSEDNISIAEIETDTFLVTVIDSRGYSNSVTLKPTVVDYIPLTINATIKRTQPTTGEMDIEFSGNYYNGSFGSINNELNMVWKYREKNNTEWIEGGSIAPIINNNTYSNGTSIISLGKIFDYQKSYEFYLEVIDKLTTLQPTFIVTQGVPIFNWGKDFFNINGSLQIDETDILKIIHGVVLYENESGTSETITLNDDINNFKKIEIYIKRGDIQTFKADNGGKTIVSCQVTGDAGNLRQFFCNITFNEKIITFGKQYFRDSDGYGQEYTGIKITKVIGYK